MGYDQRACKRSDHAFDRASPRLELGNGLVSAERYFSPTWAAAEWDRIFTKTWLLAAPVSDLREPGDFVRFNIAHESFIVVRGQDGRLRAFYNVCPHRGSRVVISDCGSVNRFSCPFHDWKFDLAGHNTYVADVDTFQPEVLKHNRNLTAVRCEEAAGLVFITMHPDPPSLRQWLGPMLPILEGYEIEKMNVVQHRRAEWAANWKMGVDAFYEFYHQYSIHPQTMTMMDDRTHIDLYPGGFSRQFVPFARPGSRCNDQIGVNPALRSMLADAGVASDQMPSSADRVRASIAAAKRRRAREFGIDYDRFSDAQLTDAVLCGVFPNVQVVTHPEAIFIHRFMPVIDTPRQMIYDTMILYRHIDAPGYGAPAWMGLSKDADLTGTTRPMVVHTPLGATPDMGEVLDQDFVQMPLVQEGVRSRGFRGAILSEQEIRLRHLHVEIDRHVLS
ncbi:MAG: aromatic ring-hydroxylating dioxygenase subunit alpha [Gammaproteobacteria bacterium]|nr:aromatic ring-hydroxylating dioxygenase subunit alpha [Gammaproteobacteria bacterium]